MRAFLKDRLAGRASAATSYEFYEVLDRWLGPWREEGYLLGYAKPYNIAFTTNRALLRNPITRGWVFRTAALLQERLLNYVVGRYRRGTLWRVTEADIRRVGFKSHALAYQQAGFARLILTTPELLPVIAGIPAAEFHPRAENFGLSVEQVRSTLRRVTPEVFHETVTRPWMIPLARAGAVVGLDLYAPSTC